MADERGPKQEPSFDTQALLGVSEAELAQARRPRSAPRARVPWAWIGGGAAVLAVVGAALALRSREPEVVSMPVPSQSPPPSASASAAASAVGEVVPAPDPSADPPPAAPSPSATVPATEVAIGRGPDERRLRPRGGEGRGAAARKPSGPDAVDQALQKLNQQPQSGDAAAAAGDWDAARSAYSTECGAGRAASCARWGTVLLEGKGGPKDEGGARDALGQACRMRSVEGCLGLSRVAEGRAALEALEAACDLASAAGCRGAAQYIESNGGGEARVISLRARACALGDRASCDGAKTSSS